MDIITGCSNSPFPNIVSQNKLNIDVCDFSKPITLNNDIGFLKIGVDNVKWSYKTVKKYGVITLFDVIEHCRYPDVVVKNINLSLDSNGILMITTPLCNSLWEKNSLGSSGWLKPPEHLHIFSKKGMEILFGNQSFDLLKFEIFEYSLFRKLLRNSYGMFWGICGVFYKFTNRKKWDILKETQTNKVQDIGLYIFKKKSI